ncbi:MAG: Hsp20/alpha crystallin family protein [Rickettsiales bacterium]|nr:Hsp20/alpha crystallin family protein [Rickettsiales bacterium]
MKEGIKKFIKEINAQQVLCFLTTILLLVVFIQNIQIRRALIQRQMPKRIDDVHARMLREFERNRLEREIRRERERDLFDMYMMEERFRPNISRYLEEEIMNAQRELENNMRYFNENGRRNRIFENKTEENIKDDRALNGKDRKNTDVKNVETKRKNETGEVKTRKNFVYRPKQEQTEKEFTLKMKLPRGVTANDVKVDLQNNNLIVKIEKSSNFSSDDVKAYSYSSFFENFLVNPTKATIKDVKVSVENNELNVVVPIIK